MCYVMLCVNICLTNSIASFDYCHFVEADGSIHNLPDFPEICWILGKKQLNKFDFH